MPPGPTASTLTFRIGTFNMASGKRFEGDLGPIDNVFEGLDFVALQEVRGQLAFSRENQAQQLGRRLGLGWLYAPAETRWGSKQFGSAVLSRLPVQFWQRIPLPRQFDRSHRNVVFLVVEVGGDRPIHVLATHVTQRDPRDRQMQLQAVFELFLALEEPAILLGDLNSPPDDRAMCELLGRRTDVDDPVGRLARDVPVGRVDWILVRGLQCVAAGVCDEHLSDHPLYWVEIERPGTGSSQPSSLEQTEPIILQNEVK